MEGGFLEIVYDVPLKLYTHVLMAITYIHVYTGYVASSHSIQSHIKRVLKMLLSEYLASLITFLDEFTIIFY